MYQTRRPDPWVQRPLHLSAACATGWSMVCSGKSSRCRQAVVSCHGSMTEIPVSMKSPVFRVARVAACERQMAAIWPLNPLIGLPSASWPATTSA